jgi:hypothetical protein
MRVVINGDSKSTAMPSAVIKEDEYQKALAETVRQTRALEDERHPAKPVSGESAKKDTPSK